MKKTYSDIASEGFVNENQTTVDEKWAQSVLGPPLMTRPRIWRSGQAKGANIPAITLKIWKSQPSSKKENNGTFTFKGTSV